MRNKTAASKVLKTIIFAAIVNALISVYLFLDLFNFYYIEDNFPEETQVIETPSTVVKVNDENGIGDNLPNEVGDSTGETEQPSSEEELPTTQIRDGFSTTDINTLNEIRNPFLNSPLITESYLEQTKIHEDNVEMIKKEIESLERAAEAIEQGGGFSFGTISANDALIPVYTSEGNYSKSETYSGRVSTDVQVTKEELETIAIAVSTKSSLDVPVEWLNSIVAISSHYYADLITTDEDGTLRSGLSQYREQAASYVKENLANGYHNADLNTNPTYNVEIALRYLDYLNKKDSDLHYVFTSYWLGESTAEDVKQKSGSYETDFSKDVILYLKSQF